METIILYIFYNLLRIIYRQTSNSFTFSTMMWRTFLPFWSADYVQSVCLLTITQNICLTVIITDINFQPLTETNLRTNQWLIILFYSIVNNLTSIFSCCIGPKCVPFNNDTKALSLCDNQVLLTFITRP